MKTEEQIREKLRKAENDFRPLVDVIEALGGDEDDYLAATILIKTLKWVLEEE